MSFARVINLIFFTINILLVNYLSVNSVLYKLEFNSTIFSNLPVSGDYFNWLTPYQVLFALVFYNFIFLAIFLSDSIFFKCASLFNIYIKRIFFIFNLILTGGLQSLWLKLVAIENLRLDSISIGNLLILRRIWTVEERKDYFINFVKSKGYDEINNKMIFSSIGDINSSGSLKDVECLANTAIINWENSIKNWEGSGFFLSLSKTLDNCGIYLFNFVNNHPGLSFFIGVSISYLLISKISSLNLQLQNLRDVTANNQTVNSKIHMELAQGLDDFIKFVNKNCKGGVNPLWAEYIHDRLLFYDAYVQNVTPIIQLTFNDLRRITVQLSDQDVATLASLVTPENLAALKRALELLNVPNTIGE